MRILSSFVFFWLLVQNSLVQAKQVSYRNCGGSVVFNMGLSPCDTEPCKMFKGTNMLLTQNSTIPHSTNNVTFQVTMEVLGLDVPVPVEDTNGCHFLQCPTRRSDRVMIQYPIVPHDYFPDLKGRLTWRIWGDNNLLLSCVETVVAIQEKEP